MPSKNNRNAHRAASKRNNAYPQSLLEDSPRTATSDIEPLNAEVLVPVEPPPLDLDSMPETDEKEQQITFTSDNAPELFDTVLQRTPELVDTSVGDEPPLLDPAGPPQQPSSLQAPSYLDTHGQGHMRSPVLAR